jgi:hypothetical protein
MYILLVTQMLYLEVPSDGTYHVHEMSRCHESSAPIECALIRDHSDARFDRLDGGENAREIVVR